MQVVAVHVPPTGPPFVLFLQWPRTASSGRKLIRVTTGGSYLRFRARFSPASSIYTPLELHLVNKGPLAVSI